MILIATVLWWGSAVLLTVSLMLTAVRLLAGPGTLDRLVSLDTLAAIAQCALALYVAWTRDTTPASAIMALALISFIGSVSVARFRVRDDDAGGPSARDVDGTAIVDRVADRRAVGGSTGTAGSGQKERSTS